MIPLSVLDLSPIVEGRDAAVALRNTLDLAQHTEALGYNRYWVAEHHNMDGVASSATSVLIGYIAGGTTTMRVGSGGIMLPNHAPLAGRRSGRNAASARRQIRRVRRAYPPDRGESDEADA